MKNSIIKKALALVCALAMVFTLCACSSNGDDNGDSAKVYKVGICNYVDDASLNQIVENIQAQLKAIGDLRGKLR